MIVSDQDIPQNAFTTLDWIGTVVAGLATLALFLFPIVVAPAFAAMFKEFGGTLPRLTHLALMPWCGAVLALPPTGLLVTALGIRRDAPIQERRALVVGSFVLGLGGNAFWLVAMYWPIFALAGNVKSG